MTSRYINRRSALLGLAAAPASMSLATRAWAQKAYPSSPVEVVVPFSPGGAVDVTGRLVARALSQALSAEFVVINRPGANSNIGNLAVVRARPDGQTLLVSSIGLAANPALYDNLGYDPLTDLAPISLISNAPVGLFVTQSLPVSNLQEFIAYLKANPNKLNYASYGLGSSPHLAAELFQWTTKTSMVHVPFKGNGPATTATVSNTTQVIFCSTIAALPFVQAGNMKGIAFADENRSEQLPDLVTFKEAGLDFSVGTFFGLLAPAKTPPDIIEALSKAIRGSLNDTKLQEQMRRQGAVVVGSTPDEFAAFLTSEIKRLAEVIRSTKS